MNIIPLNTDVKGNCACIKANYYKMGGANFIGHSKDGFKATCIMEIIERDTPMKGNYTEPNVLTPKRTEFGKKIRKKYESGEVELSRHDMTKLEPREDGVSNTITSVLKDNYLAEPLRIPQATKKGFIEVMPGSLFDMSYPESKTRRGRVQEGGKVSPTLMASGEGSCLYEGKVEQSYRIRKLTPKECFRLMGVSDADIEKIQNCGVSQSQQYKMAGNSIVVDVLEHIFRKMFVETGQESKQLSLF